MSGRDILLGLAVPVLWGLGLIVAKPATAHFQPIFAMVLIYAITAVALFRPARIRTPWITLLTFSVLGGSLQASLLFTGLDRLPGSIATLVIQCQVPFAVLAAWAIGSERLSPTRITGIAVALAGVALIAGKPDAPAQWLPLAMVIAGGLSWAIGQAIVRAASRDDGTVLTGALAALAAPQMLLMSLLLEDGQWTALRTATVSHWAHLLFVALFGFILAYALWFRLLGRYRVDQVTPFSLLMPFVGVVAGALLLGEAISLWATLGGAIILAGLALIVFSGPRPQPAAAAGE